MNICLNFNLVKVSCKGFREKEIKPTKDRKHGVWQTPIIVELLQSGRTAKEEYEIKPTDKIRCKLKW